MATFPPRVFGYRPCICDHATHVRRAKKWRFTAKQAYIKMMSLPLVNETIMVDFRKMKELFENEEKDNDLIHAENERLENEYQDFRRKYIKDVTWLHQVIKDIKDSQEHVGEKWDEMVQRRNEAVEKAQAMQKTAESCLSEKLEARKLINDVKNCRMLTCAFCRHRKTQVRYLEDKVEALQKLLFQKKKALQDLPPTPEQFKPKSPVSSIKVRKRKKRRGVHWGETSTRVVRTSYTRYFGD